jgi:hypothetical protein
MTNVSKIYLLSVIIFLGSLTVNAQNDSAIFIREIGWRIELPSDFKISNDDFISRTVNVKTIMTATNAQGDFFNVAYDSSHLLTVKDWKNSDYFFIVSILNAIGLKKFIARKESDGIYLIDRIEFKVFKMDCTMQDHSILHLMFLSSFYKNHYILINYFFHNNPYVIFAMIAKSKFDR